MLRRFRAFLPMVMTAARYRARNLAKRELKSRGIRLHDVDAVDIDRVAAALLVARRPQLFEEAKTLTEGIKHRGRVRRM
jgi:hypothetical protein